MSLCPCRGAGMYLVEENGRSVMRVCDCPAGHRRKEYLAEDQARETARREGKSSREEAEPKLPF